MLKTFNSSARSCRAMPRFLPTLCSRLHEKSGFEIRNAVRMHSVGSHTHTHDHGSDKEMLELVKALKKEGKSPELKLAWLGLYSNIGLAAAKGIGGVALQSSILVADAAHQLGDTLSDLVTLATLKICSKKPTQKYPAGFGKWETIGTFTVSGLLVAVSVGIAHSSLSRLYTILFPYAGSEHTHIGHSHNPSQLLFEHPFMALGLIFGSVVLKEWLFRKSK